VATANKTLASSDTIYALSSGPPPAAIAIIRISGPRAGAALEAIAGPCPAPRHASLRALRDAVGEILDHALTLWFPGPATATGEDLAELHLHGGRAVVEATLKTLAALKLKLAEPGEFTRRALLNGRMDLSAVEGLADLLAAETEHQRKEALRRADGALSRRLGDWARALIAIAARIEAEIDYDGEVELDDTSTVTPILTLAASIDAALAVPPAERLRDGIRVAIVGPPNAGKSTLFNALVGRDAAIVSDIPGTTRDAIERPLSIAGMPFLLIDTAGLRETNDPIERIGVERAHHHRALADIVIDLLGDMPETDQAVIPVSTKTDIAAPRDGALAVSAITGQGIAALHARIAEIGSRLLPREGEVALDRRYRERLYEVRTELDAALASSDPLLRAEHIRVARERIDSLTGGAGIEDMLDALFGRFCLGK
jgi:tRNA modification GTPase